MMCVCVMNVCGILKLSSMVCDTVLNISSGRCVLRNGRVGKSLRGRLRCCKSCLNVCTNRCVNASVCSKGKGSKSRSRSVGALTSIPNEIYGLVRECKCQKQWVKMTRIGSGAYGSA